MCRIKQETVHGLSEVLQQKHNRHEGTPKGSLAGVP